MRDLNGDEQATFFYLVLLLIVIGGSMVLGSRKRLNQTLQNLGIWMLIFVGFVGAYSMRAQIEEQIFPSRPQMIDTGTVSINRAWDGHFYVDILVNNQRIKFIIDTGASHIVLSRQDAEKIGIRLDTLNFSGSASTANGIVATARVQLRSMILGRFSDRDLRASVNDGDMDRSLLGMDYLNRFDKIEISQNRILLIRE